MVLLPIIKVNNEREQTITRRMTTMPTKGIMTIQTVRQKDTKVRQRMSCIPAVREASLLSTMTKVRSELTGREQVSISVRTLIRM